MGDEQSNTAAIRVLRHIAKRQDLLPSKRPTRASIANELGLTRANAEQAIRSLLEQNLITEKQPECFRLTNTNAAARTWVAMLNEHMAAKHRASLRGVEIQYQDSSQSRT